MARDLQAEPLFPAKEIQGDILVGLPKNHQHLMFFKIEDASKFRSFLKGLEITSVDECLKKRAAIAANKAAKINTIIPTPGLNIAFTRNGLEALGVQGLSAAPAEFLDGMAASQAKLNDPPQSEWRILRNTIHLHGVFLVTGATHAEVVDVIDLRLVSEEDNGWRLLHEEVGQVRPAPVRGHEHFGYADGVSQPGVRGRVDATTPLTPQLGDDPDQGMPGQDLLWPGEFVFGYNGQDPNGPTFTKKGDVEQPPIPFMEDGSFLVFRRLAQLVPEFNQSVKQAAMSIAAPKDAADPTLLGAQLVGRWKSGASLELAPLADDFAVADGTPNVNDFEFGDDREGLKCPWAAHVRKAYPRDDVPGNPSATDEAEIAEAEAFTQTHRMLRRGIAFGPELTEQEALDQKSAGGHKTRGLLFVCYVTSIADQFEFVQQSWCNNADFSQPGSGVDAIIGQSPQELRPFLGAAPFSNTPDNKPQLQLKGFVHLEGGAYFFAPSIKQMRELI